MSLNLLKNYKNFDSSQRTVVTIGTFDGVHVGHQKIIEQLVDTAKKENEHSVLLTFFPHPRMVLQEAPSIKLINTVEERVSLLKKSGLDSLIVHPFDKAFSRLSALDFVRNVLVDHLNISKLIIGYDHRFGKNREGNFEQLEEYGHVFDFKVLEIPSQDINAVSVSSTKIRRALQAGDVQTANRYLGRAFTITGTVVLGNQLGKTIGFPTANIQIAAPYKLIPQKGAYLVKTTLSGKPFYGMMNIGVRPTISGTEKTIEIHFFDWTGDLYGKTLTVEFLDFLRDEERFDSLDALKTQLSKDKIKSLALIERSFSIRSL